MSGIIDTDVHYGVDREQFLRFLPKVWHDQYIRAGIVVSTLWPSPIGVDRKDVPGGRPEDVLRHYIEPNEVSYAILNGGSVIASLQPDIDYANALCSAGNAYLAEVWLRADRRFKGSIMINSTDPQQAVREIEKWAAHPDMVQVLMTSGSRKPYGQRAFHPIYEAAEHYGLPVAIHAGTEGHGMAYPPSPAGYPSRYMEWHNILHLNYMTHINSLVCEGVFERFPKLRFVAIEGGVSWLPHLMWRADKNYMALRASTPWLRRLPSEYIKEHVRLTTQPIEEPARPGELYQVYQMVDGARTLMFASDFPHWDFDNPKAALQPIPREMRQRIFWDTAAELYGFTAAETEGSEGR